MEGSGLPLKAETRSLWVDAFHLNIKIHFGDSTHFETYPNIDTNIEGTQ